MNFESSNKTSTDGKRASHVKWEGRTIALGTFSSPQEATEKCDQAKALTKKWRATMTPKPDVEWVKATLERLKIRVVNDRPGRRKKRTINEFDQQNVNSIRNTWNTSTKLRRGNDSSSNLLGNINHSPDLPPLNQNYEMNGSFNLGSGDMSGRSIDRRFSNPMQYGISSLDGMTTNNNNVPNLALPNLGNNYNSIIGLNNRNASSTLNYEQQQMISNILRMDKPQTISQRSNSVEERLGILAATGCNQHYEVLKEHHRNLVIELEETIALMNLYYGKNNMQKNIMDRLKEAIV